MEIDNLRTNILKMLCPENLNSYLTFSNLILVSGGRPHPVAVAEPEHGHKTVEYSGIGLLSEHSKRYSGVRTKVQG